MVINHEELAIRSLCQFGPKEFLSNGIVGEHILDPVYNEMFEWGMERFRVGKGLTPEGMEARFTSYKHSPVTEEDMSIAIEILINKRLQRLFALEIDRHITRAGDLDNVEPVIASLYKNLNDLLVQAIKSPLVDGFGGKDGVGGLCLDDQEKRERGKIIGIPTGLKRFDNVIGGLQKKELVAIIGRPGRGKSWVGVSMVKNAIKVGRKVLYYPFEMSLINVMHRLHAFFAQDMDFKEITQTGLEKGNVNLDYYKEFLQKCSQKYSGQLKILDAGGMQQRYTTSIIEGDLQRDQDADMVLIDYLTLLKSENPKISEDYQVIRELSSNLKIMSMKYDIPVVVVAQVNRAAIRRDALNEPLPRLEHISFGDALGADSDKVISINKHMNTLYYGLVKNRNGQEFGRTPMNFDVDIGILEEIEKEESNVEIYDEEPVEESLL